MLFKVSKKLTPFSLFCKAIAHANISADQDVDAAVADGNAVHGTEVLPCHSSPSYVIEHVITDDAAVG